MTGNPPGPSLPTPRTTRFAHPATTVSLSTGSLSTGSLTAGSLTAG